MRIPKCIPPNATVNLPRQQNKVNNKKKRLKIIATWGNVSSTGSVAVSPVLCTPFPLFCSALLPPISPPFSQHFWIICYMRCISIKPPEVKSCHQRQQQQQHPQQPHSQQQPQQLTKVQHFCCCIFLGSFFSSFGQAPSISTCCSCQSYCCCCLSDFFLAAAIFPYPFPGYFHANKNINM